MILTGHASASQQGSCFGFTFAEQSCHPSFTQSMVKADFSSLVQLRHSLDTLSWSSSLFFFHFLRSVLLVRLLETREKQPYTDAPQRDSTLFIDVYMQYIMYVFFKTFRIWLLDRNTNQNHYVHEFYTSNTRKVMAVMHLFILCVNLLTCFFVFMSVLSALHETDGGIYISHVFLYLVSWKLVLKVYHNFFSF